MITRDAFEGSVDIVAEMRERLKASLGDVIKLHWYYINEILPDEDEKGI